MDGTEGKGGSHRISERMTAILHMLRLSQSHGARGYSGRFPVQTREQPLHRQCRVESIKSEVEHQIQSMLDVFSLLFRLLSADKLNLSGGIV